MSKAYKAIMYYFLIVLVLSIACNKTAELEDGEQKIVLKNGEFADTEQIQEIINLVAMLNTASGYNSALRLANLGPDAIPYLLEAMEDDNKRTFATLALQKLAHPEPQVIDALVKATNDSNIQVKIYALGGLGEMGNTEASVISAITEKITDDNYEVCYTAIWALHKIAPKNEMAAFRLFDALSSAWPSIRYYAADVLVELSEDLPWVEDKLVELAQTSNIPAIRIASAYALNDIGIEYNVVVNTISDVFSKYSLDWGDPDFDDTLSLLVDDYISNGICILIEITETNEASSDAILEIVTSEEQRIRKLFVRSLISLSEEMYGYPLIDNLGEPPFNESFVACPSEKTIEYVVILLRDKSPYVRYVAAFVASKIKDNINTFRLKEELKGLAKNDGFISKDGVFLVREMANYALKQLE